MKTRSSILCLLIVLSLLPSAVTPVFAQDAIPAAPAPGSAYKVTADRLQQLRLAEPVRQSLSAQVSPAGMPPAVRLHRDRHLPVPVQGERPDVAAIRAQGDKQVDVAIYLKLPGLAQVAQNRTPEQRVAYAAELAATQARVSSQVTALGGAVYAQLKTLSSAVLVQMPASQAAAVAALPEVAGLSLVRNYEKDLSETVPFIGAADLQALGITGAGTKVAVLDSGIDYTHLAFGGPGTVAAAEAAYFGPDPSCAANANFAQPICANALPADPVLFGPNAPKVKGGWDFVGESWPDNWLRQDPNPIDAPAAPPPLDGGHGTHVGDIIGGFGYPAGDDYPAKGPGVAPGAELWAFKVCSSISTSCSGLAMLAAIDAAADLDRNPATNDPADVINMSIGSDYGQLEDDTTYLSNQAVAYGIIVVASAGNGADKPFILGTPSSADGVISVAQTTVPSAKRFVVEFTSTVTSGIIDNAVWQPWSVSPEVAGLVSGPLYFNGADAGKRLGCTDPDGTTPFTPGELAGQVVLVDRGVCAVSQKIGNIADAGGMLGIVGFVNDDAPGEFSYGGGNVTISAYSISKADASRLKAQMANGPVAIVDPNSGVPKPYAMVSSSSRGPRINDNRIKPDIGAPGASVSAQTGTGAQTTAFGGTSGAAPMVAGVAALLKGVFGNSLLVQQYKALLMNTADTQIFLNEPGTQLAPVSRIGAGQVNARSAYLSRLIAWDSTSSNPLQWTGSLSFGYQPVTDQYVATRTLTIKNLANLSSVTVDISSAFRFADDEYRGVTVTPLLNSVSIPANGTVEVPVLLAIDSRAVKTWEINKGALGNDGATLTNQEYDGYLTIVPWGLGAPITVPWHVLPKRAADVSVALGVAGAPGSSALVNASPVTTGTVDAFNLVDVSPNQGYVVSDCASAGLPPGCNFTIVDLKEIGVRELLHGPGANYLEFGITTWEWPYRTAEYPSLFVVAIDVDGDGVQDYQVYNQDATNSTDGRSLVWVYDIAGRTVTAYFYTDSTFNTANWILTVPLEAVGLAPGAPFDFWVEAYDNYFTGRMTDCAPAIDGYCADGYYSYTISEPRFDLVGPDALFPAVPPSDFTVFEWNSSPGSDIASPSQIGFLFMYRDAPVGRESDHLILAEPFSPAEGLTLSAAPQPAPFGADVTVSALVTDTAGPLADQQVFFSPMQTTLNARMTGVPAASGTTTFTVDLSSNTVQYIVDFTGVLSPTGSHLHRGWTGPDGPPVAWLWDPTGVNAPSTLPATGAFTLTQEELTLFMQKGMVANVESEEFPGGAIAGPVTGAPSAFTNAEGVATYLAPGSLLRASSAVAVLPIYAFSGPLMEQINIVYQSAFVAAATMTAAPTTTMATESVTVTLNVTDTFGRPMMGQTVYFSDGKFHAALNGANEAPPNDSAATGQAEFSLDFATGVGAYRLDFTGVATPTMAHIHVGAAGENGPPIVWLYDATGVNATDKLPATGVFTLTQEQLMQLVMGGVLFNEGLYVNVHSQAAPTGEMRGQITGAKRMVTTAEGMASAPWTSPIPGAVTVRAFIAAELLGYIEVGSTVVNFTPLPLTARAYLPLVGKE